MENTVDTRRSIPQYFCGKNVFITGGSGFMGKCLIEKLLRSCPDVGIIYMLIRSKKALSVADRYEKIVQNAVFSTLKQSNPDALNKIKPIIGDVSELNLGLSDEDRQELINNVEIVYHLAATVRFDETLTRAIIMNTRGTREMCKLILEFKKISVFLHMSTSYCQMDKHVIEEKLYPPHGDWHEAISIAENADEQILNHLTSKYVACFPNTYTFTKSLGEHVVNDMCNGKVPTIIYRPSIVISAAHEPIPGYMDNFNGPIGLLTGLAKGIIRTTYSDQKVRLSLIPVDTAIKGMIIATWDKGCEINVKPISWYAASGKNILEVSSCDISAIGKELVDTLPVKPIWYPSYLASKNATNSVNRKSFVIYYVYFMLLQLIPALIIDFIFKILRIKFIKLAKIQRKIYIVSYALSYFSHNECDIRNDNFLRLEERLLGEDIEAFGYRLSDIIVSQIIYNMGMYIEVHIFKADVKKQQKIMKQHLRNLWIIYIITKSIFYSVAAWIVYKMFLETIIGNCTTLYY